MKKLIFSIFIFFLHFSTANANLIELEKCFFTTNWWDYTKQGTDLEYPKHEQIKWTEENYYRASTRIKISKKIWQNNFHLFHKFKDDYSKDRYIQKIDMYPRINYVILNTIEYTKEELDKIKKLGGKIFKKYERRVYSIDVENGIITEMHIFSDEYYNYQLSSYSELWKGKSNQKYSKVTEEDKKTFHRFYIDRNHISFC
tara:strand:+ start:2063 stop:2662 length:600 start_codon:yes stop_codon:yes gene_type:complete